jgi:hypothetical protein
MRKENVSEEEENFSPSSLKKLFSSSSVPHCEFFIKNPLLIFLCAFAVNSSL